MSCFRYLNLKISLKKIYRINNIERIVIYVKHLKNIYNNAKLLGKVGKRNMSKIPALQHAKRLVKGVNFFPWTETHANNYLAYLKRKHLRHLILTELLFKLTFSFVMKLELEFHLNFIGNFLPWL